MKSLNVNGHSYYEDLVTFFENTALPPSVFYYFKKSSNKIIRFLMVESLLIVALGYVGVFVFVALYVDHAVITENVFYIGTAASFAVLSLGVLFFLLIVLRIKKIRNSFTKHDLVEFYLKANKDILPTVSQCRTATKNAYVDFEIKKEKEKMIAASNYSNALKCISDGFDHINYMSGTEFEEYCCRILALMGYNNIKRTPDSGDKGVDIVASKDNERYAFQCKRYSYPLGNSPVQEVFAGARYYNANRSVVITNSSFTKGARELASATCVELWDGRTLSFLCTRIIELLEEEIKKLISQNFDKEKKNNELREYVNNLSDEKIDELFVQLSLLDYSGCKSLSSFEAKTKEFISKYI